MQAMTQICAGRTIKGEGTNKEGRTNKSGPTNRNGRTIKDGPTRFVDKITTRHVHRGSIFIQIQVLEL
jgi:hypothetical protein